MKTVNFFKIFSICFIVLGVSIVGLASVFAGTTYGASTQITHKTVINNNAQMNQANNVQPQMNQANNTQQQMNNTQQQIQQTNNMQQQMMGR